MTLLAFKRFNVNSDYFFIRQSNVDCYGGIFMKKNVLNVETKNEQYFRSKVKELTERKCLVEVKYASMRHYTYGISFAKLPENMKIKKLSESAYVFSYDSKSVLPNWFHIHLPVGNEACFALYKINEDLYVAFNITNDTEHAALRNIFTQHNQINSRPTGFINQLKQVHISAWDFYTLTGYTIKDWANNQIKKSGGLVAEWDTSDNKCLFSVYYESSDKEYAKIPVRSIPVPAKGIKKINTTTLNFYTPSCFQVKGNVKVGQTLIDTLTFDEQGRARITYEALPRICECCGRPIYMDGESHLAGSMCAPCVDELAKAREIIAEMGITASSDRLETALSEVDKLKSMAISIIKA